MESGNNEMLPEYFYDLIMYKAREKYNGDKFNTFWVKNDGWEVPVAAEYNDKGRATDISIWNVYHNGKDEGCDFNMKCLEQLNMYLRGNI